MKRFSLAYSLLLTCGILRGGVPSLPLLFEQHPEGCLARTAGGSVFVTSDGALLRTGNTGVKLRLVGAQPSVPRAEHKLTSVSNYLSGNNPQNWRRGVPHFAQVRSTNVYPGIDLIYYGKDGELEYDFVVAAGAEPRNIDLIVDGAKRLSTDSDGNLLIDTGATTIRQLRPVVYQSGGAKVDARYRVTASNRVRFELGKYDRTRQLVIDPVIQYTRYIGKLGQESAIGVALDAAGNTIYVGETNSDEMIVGNYVQRIRNGDNDAFVAKISPSGDVQFVTYLGGNGPDTARSVAVDPSNGDIYVAGTTASADFPMRNAVQRTFGEGEVDGFLTRITSSGSDILFSTFLGGRGYDFLNGVAMDPTGSVWVTGWTTSPNYPVKGGFQSGPAGGGGDVFVTEIDPSKGLILYSSYIGGNGIDLAGGIAVDNRGYVWVTGTTTSTIFPVSANATQKTLAGKQDAFVFQLDPNINDLVFSTYFGGPGDDLGVKVATDTGGNAYITGFSDSGALPVTTGAYQNSNRGGTDGFVAKVSTGRVVWATYLGGGGDDFPGSIIVDASGSPYIVGWTNSSNFPLRSPVQASYQGGSSATQGYDITLTRLSPAGDALLFSTYLGGIGEDKAYGIALDRSNNILIAGSTTSSNLPGAVNAFGSNSSSLYDGLGIRVSADTSVSFVGANPGTLTLTARTTDTQLVQQTIAVAGTAGSITFTTSTNQPWLRVDPVSGTAPSNLTVTVNPALLTAGVNQGEIVIQAAANTVRVPVTVTAVQVATVASVNPASLSRGSSDATITVTGSGFTTASRVEVNTIQLQTTFVDARTLRAIMPASLLLSEGTLSLVVVGPEGRSNAASITVGSSAPALTGDSIRNGATGQTGSIAPGEIVTVSGTQFGPANLVNAAPVNGIYGTSLNGLSVLFDGTPAPVLWAMQGRVAVLVPYSLAGRANTSVIVDVNGVRSLPVNVPVQAAAPGLFTADSTGRGPVVAVNDDGTYNAVATPAQRGTFLTLYGTGEGLTNPALQSGQIVPAGTLPRPVLPVFVFFGDVRVQADYAGGSPGLVSGVLQVNVRIPENAPVGDNVKVVLQIGDYSSSPEVTASIR